MNHKDCLNHDTKIIIRNRVQMIQRRFEDMNNIERENLEYRYHAHNMITAEINSFLEYIRPCKNAINVKSMIEPVQAIFNQISSRDWMDQCNTYVSQRKNDYAREMGILKLASNSLKRKTSDDSDTTEQEIFKLAKLSISSKRPRAHETDTEERLAKIAKMMEEFTESIPL